MSAARGAFEVLADTIDLAILELNQAIRERERARTDAIRRLQNIQSQLAIVTSVAAQVPNDEEEAMAIAAAARSRDTLQTQRAQAQAHLGALSTELDRLNERNHEQGDLRWRIRGALG